MIPCTRVPVSPTITVLIHFRPRQSEGFIRDYEQSFVFLFEPELADKYDRSTQCRFHVSDAGPT